MSKIFLLGYMGSGKSYLGKRLAQNLHIDFLDLDELIELKNGMSIAEIFAKKGEAFFRQTESDCLKSLKNQDHKIIALGGGTPCFFDNMDWINEHGVSIYLKTATDVLVQRLRNEKDKRPLIQQLSERELPDFIENNVANRSHFYEQAHLEYFVKTGNEGIVEDLTKFLERMTSLVR